MEQSGLVENKRVAYFEYDFARDGGAAGEISVGGDAIPVGAIITSGIIHVKTAVTSGGSATLQIKAVGTDDVLTSTAKSSLTLNALIDCVPDGAATNMIRCTANVTALTFTVGTADLTAGKVCVALEYVMTA